VKITAGANSFACVFRQLAGASSLTALILLRKRVSQGGEIKFKFTEENGALVIRYTFGGEGEGECVGRITRQSAAPISIITLVQDEMARNTPLHVCTLGKGKLIGVQKPKERHIGAVSAALHEVVICALLR